MKQGSLYRWAVISYMIVGLSGPTLACGYDGQINNPFTLSYPGTLILSVNTQNALASGKLTPLPPLTGQEGLMRIQDWLGKVQRHLDSASLPESFSLYLVDSGLWTRFELRNGAVNMQSHAAPHIGEAVLLSSEASLVAIMKGQLSTADANRYGLLQWSPAQTESILVQTVETALRTAG